MASLRYERRIAASAEVLWRVFCDPRSIPDWFPGVVSCTVRENVRVLTLASGIEMPEEILVIDPIQRRFAYRVTAPLYRFHLATIDAIALGENESLAVYSTTAEPDTLALLTGAGTAAALDEIARLAERVET